MLFDTRGPWQSPTGRTSTQAGTDTDTDTDTAQVIG